MNAAYDVKKKIEALEIQHPVFAGIHDALNDRIQDALDGDAARIEWVAVTPPPENRTTTFPSFLSGAHR